MRKRKIENFRVISMIAGPALIQREYQQLPQGESGESRLMHQRCQEPRISNDAESLRRYVIPKFCEFIPRASPESTAPKSCSTTN
jgi:hypothetical protein